MTNSHSHTSYNSTTRSHNMDDSISANVIHQANFHDAMNARQRAGWVRTKNGDFMCSWKPLSPQPEKIFVVPSIFLSSKSWKIIKFRECSLHSSILQYSFNVNLNSGRTQDETTKFPKHVWSYVIFRRSTLPSSVDEYIFSSFITRAARKHCVIIT